MSGFIFEAKQEQSFKKRNKRSRIRILLISIAIFLVVFSLSNWYYSLIIVIIFSIIQLLKAERRNQFFINYFELNNDQVLIKYMYKNQNQILSGEKREFAVKKEVALNRTKTVYLAIYKEDNLQIKQFEIDEWTEKVFDDIVLAFK
jgi:hypothetical protein